MPYFEYLGAAIFVLAIGQRVVLLFPRDRAN